MCMFCIFICYTSRRNHSKQLN